MHPAAKFKKLGKKKAGQADGAHAEVRRTAATFQS